MEHKNLFGEKKAQIHELKVTVDIDSRVLDLTRPR
jgi:hypothetical protein